MPDTTGKPASRETMVRFWQLLIFVMGLVISMVVLALPDLPAGRLP